MHALIQGIPAAYTSSGYQSWCPLTERMGKWKMPRQEEEESIRVFQS
jgi:hypothetical protein